MIKYFKILSMHLLLILWICSFIYCNGNNPIQQTSIDYIGTWKMVALSVNSKKSENEIIIDSTYNDDTFSEIIIFYNDSLVFYVKDHVNDPSMGINELRTIHTNNDYYTSNDTLVISSPDFNINVKMQQKNDTLFLNFNLDQTNPFSMEYGLGSMVRKYVHHTGSVPPNDWPEIY